MPPKYREGVNDADGKEFLGGAAVQHVIHMDTTAGGFGDPTNNNHYGFAADGKAYANGIEATTEGYAFCTASDWLESAWVTSDADPFKRFEATGTISIGGADVMSMDCTSDNWPDGCGVEGKGRWVLQGDFDIQVDFDNWVDADNDGQFQIAVCYEYGGVGGTQMVYFARKQTGYAFQRWAGSHSTIASAVKADSSGKLRMTRVGGLFRAYYDDSGWVEVGSGYTHPRGADDVFARVALNCDDNHQATVDASSFTINSGTVSNLAGWARQAADAHTGSLGAMPSRMLLGVATDDSVDLIDPDTEKLWRRFVDDTAATGSSNVLGTFAGSDQRPRYLAWNDGVLMIAYGSEIGAAQGGSAIWVDFTMDDIRLHRESASTITGAHYLGTRSNAIGAIAQRNDGKGYSGDDNDYNQRDYRTFSTALYRDATYEYRASATGDGVTMFRWKRWYLDESPDVENSEHAAGHVRWCGFDQNDGTLFYLTDSTIYGEPLAGCTAPMDGGAWTADNSLSLPGTQSVDSQYVAAVQPAGDLFMAADEGVYSSAWPASFRLRYGKVGSGAAHEILPDYDRVTCIAVVDDPDTQADKLLIGQTKQWPTEHRAIIIDIATNTVEESIDVTDDLTSEPVSISL